MSVLRSLTDQRSLWTGLLGTLSVGWGSCHPEFSFNPSGWSVDWVNAIGRVLPSPVDKLLIVWGVLTLIWAWWRLYEDRERPSISPAIVLATWSVPLVLVPPVLSQDASLYADLGWTLRAGADPYTVGLAASGGPFLSAVDPLWAGSGVAYPPVSLLIDQAVVSITGAHPYWSVVAMRIPAVLSVAAMLWLVPRIAGRLGMPSGSAVILGVLNPLVLLHFIGGAHSDAPMVALVLAAIWAVMKRPTWWMTFLVAPAIVGLAMCVKQQAGLAVVAVAGLPVAAALCALPPPRRLWTLAWRTSLVTVTAVTTFVGLSWGTGLGFGWTRWLDVMGRAGTLAPLGLLDSAWGIVAGESLGLVGRPSTYLLAAVVVLVIVRFADRPLRAVGWGSFAAAVLGQSVQPWYLPLGLVLLAVVPITSRQRYVTFGIAMAFLLWNALQTAVWHGQ